MPDDDKLRGRPTDYRKEYDQKARKLCLLGATDAQIADFFEVSEVTVNAWKHAHPSFLKSLKAGKMEADATVAEALYKRAIGYKHKAVKIMQHEGKSFEHEYTERYPPETTAGIFWLHNRQRNLWRQRQEVLLDQGAEQSFNPNHVLVEIVKADPERFKTAAADEDSGAVPAADAMGEA